MNGAPKNLRVAPAGSTTNGPKVDPNDPQVRKLVYNAYREMLSKKHADTNVMINKAPQELVTKDHGVGDRVESMMRQQSELKGGNMNAGGPPPPPPPPPIPGVIPSSRLPSEIPPRPAAMNQPPAALAGAMMKDRKPFTYTPGGLDLSEISNQYQPNHNGNNVDQVPNSADFGAPVQSRSFRVLQNVLDHHDTAGSDDEITNYMQPIVPQAQASVSQGGLQTQQPIYNQTQYQPQQISEQAQSASQAQYQNQPHSTQNVNMPKPKEGPTSSRFFRMLQTITDTLPDGAEPQGPIHIPNMRPAQQHGQYQPQPNQYQPQPNQYQPQPNQQLPAYQQHSSPYLQSGVNNAASTEQTAPEPKKYMGGNIPSRSFRMLQAMTGSDDVAGPGQSDL